MSKYQWCEQIPKHLNQEHINRELVNEFAGYVSMCWSDIEKAGTFESEKVLIACSNLISYLGSELPIADRSGKKSI